MEKEDVLDDMKDSPSETFNCWKERLSDLSVSVQWVIMSSDMSTPTTCSRKTMFQNASRIFYEDCFFARATLITFSPRFKDHF